MGIEQAHREVWLAPHVRDGLRAERDAAHARATADLLTHREARHAYRPRRVARRVGTEAERGTVCAWVASALSVPVRRALALEGERFGLGGGGFSGYPIVWSWLQYLGSGEYVADIVTAHYQQHVDALPLQVLLLPFETCAFLLSLAPASWSIQTVIPLGMPYATDGPTGLDEVAMGSNAVWGVDPILGPYFDDVGADAPSEARLFLDGSGNPYLLT